MNVRRSCPAKKYVALWLAISKNMSAQGSVHSACAHIKHPEGAVQKIAQQTVSRTEMQCHECVLQVQPNVHCNYVAPRCPKCAGCLLRSSETPCGMRRSQITARHARESTIRHSAACANSSSLHVHDTQMRVHGTTCQKQCNNKQTQKAEASSSRRKHGGNGPQENCTLP